jgi:hypothetical protein
MEAITPNEDDIFGIPVSETHPALQTDVFKELINKIAWAIGNSYRVPYRNPRAGARKLAIDLAGSVIESAGYPRHIAKNPD